MFKALHRTLATLALTSLALPALASPSLQERLATPPQNAFEHGTLQVLRAVETSLQTRYEYGLGDTFSRSPVMRLALPGGPNPRPKQAAPDTLNTIIDTLLRDLEDARATLARAADAPEPFGLKLGDIWLDANMNTIRDTGEGVVELLGENLMGRRAAREFAKSALATYPPSVRFDAADHAWLTAYTHMLSGALNAYRAYDSAPVIADLFEARTALQSVPQIPEYYDLEAIRAELAKLRGEYQVVQADAKALSAEVRPLRDAVRQIQKDIKALNASDATDKAEHLAQLNLDLDAMQDKQDAASKASRAANTRRSTMRTQIRSLEQQLPETRRRGFNPAEFSTQIDTAYIILTTLAQEPDAARVKTAFAHWREMIAHNRAFWALLDAETDNENEWIPNSRQTSALPFDVTEDIAKTWQAILDEGEALLDGKLLVPHPLLPEGHGVSLKLYGENPAALELVSVVHGRALYPFVLKGPTISRINWSRFARLTGGNAGGFALWFN